MTRFGAAIALVVAVGAAQMASADRYEATITLRPSGALARLDDVGVRGPATVAGGGGAAGLSWGVRNWLDLGADVGAYALARASYDGAMADIFGVPQTGALSRTTRLAQLRGLSTLRLGVAWVPVIQLALGVGGRQRTAARFTYGSAVVIPDGEEAKVNLDLVVGLRVGLDHRVNRRWTIGVSAGAMQCVGLGAPDLQLFDAQLSLAYSWYPLW